jgi:hypothetical protein
MNRRCATLAAIIFVLGGAPLLAAESANPAPQLTKRQLADCMTRRMYADRTVSYYDAAKACKDQLRDRKADAALNSAPKPVS